MDTAEQQHDPVSDGNETEPWLLPERRFGLDRLKPAGRVHLAGRPFVFRAMGKLGPRARKRFQEAARRMQGQAAEEVVRECLVEMIEALLGPEARALVVEDPRDEFSLEELAEVVRYVVGDYAQASEDGPDPLGMRSATGPEVTPSAAESVVTSGGSDLSHGL